MSHNTNITNVQPPWGGYPKFVDNGYLDHHLALWMQQSGYNTYYAGKLFNGHTTANYDSPAMTGYNGSEFFLEPFAYQYFNVSVTRDGQPPVNPVGVYSTDLISQTAQEFLDGALEDAERPFFMTLAPVAPHGFLQESPVTLTGPPEVAERHRNLFPNYTIPRTENFNPETPSSVNWISELERLNDTVLAYNDEYQRLRLRSLMAVDEMVGDVVRRLDDAGVLDNTFVIYTTDNGFHISQHRLHPGKMCGLETDINVPFVVRGPGVDAGGVRSAPSTHTDLAPTIMKLAGNPIDDKRFDGTPMALGLPDEAASIRLEHVSVEFWGIGLGESKYASDQGPLEYMNNTYKGLRIEAEDYGYYYSVWCNNERELYDMKADHAQLNNLLSSRAYPAPCHELRGQSIDAITDRLDALMMVLKSCREQACYDPWRSLHPDGRVRSLADALSVEYDEFYRGQTKVQFDYCSRGYLLDAEGPQEFDVFGHDEERRIVERLMRYDRDWSLRV